MSRASTNGVLSGDRLARTISDPEMRRVLQAALPPGEVSRLRIISSQLRKVERSRSAPAVDTENLPNMLVGTFIQIQAARAGRALGTSTIQAPGIAVSRARQLLAQVATDRSDAIIRAALEDPRLLSDLLVGPSASPQRLREAESRLTSWAIGVLAASGEE